MISKVAGYQGFSSYGDIPYPSLKPGRTVLSPTDVWEATTRPRDEISLYENHAHLQTVYKNEVSNTVEPKHYQNHQHVKKGLQTQYQFKTTGKNTLQSSASVGFLASNKNPGAVGGFGAGSNANSEQQQFNATSSSNAFGTGNLDQTSKLQTGVEHWKSTYSATRIQDKNSLTKATRPEWTLPKQAYQVDCKLGPTEYKTSFGEFGTKPTDKLNTFGQQVVNKHEDTLKMGTTQSTYHVPNYGGFIPAARTVGLALQHASAEEPRKDKHRGTIIDNYHTKIPGYAGHQPSAPVNQRGFLREHCFSTTSTLKL